MTIINSVVQGEAAYILTDMAWIDARTGRLLAIDSKFIGGLHFPWVVAVTGSSYLRELAYQLEWRQPRNAKELHDMLPLVLHGTRSLLVGDEYQNFTMAIRAAVWCEHTQRARVFHLDFDPERCALWGITPGEVCEAMVLIPGGDEIIGELGSLDISAEAVMDDRRFNMERDGVALVAAQRQAIRVPLRSRADLQTRRPLALIGGGVQLARVTKSDVAIKTLHRWTEDRPGELITP